MTLPTGIVAGNSGHISHHNTIHAAINPVVAPFGLRGIAHGLLIDRPPAGTRDRLYWATDTSQLFIDVGTDWQMTNALDIWVNVMDPRFGAVGNGVTDDTASILAARNAAAAADLPLVFPAGHNFVYNGPGLEGWDDMRIICPGPGRTRISLGASSYFLAPTVRTWSLLLQGFFFVGGRGVYHGTYTGVNVGDWHRVINVYAYLYTGAAFSHNASDFPQWHIQDCILWAANYTTSMGIAFKGLSDVCTFENIEFRGNRIGLKLADGGNSAYVDKCSFLNYNASAGFPRVGIWCVPDTDFVNSGEGFTVTPSTRFGNEALEATDYHIVYADAGAGADWGSQFPNLGADSTGVIAGHNIGGMVAGTGASPAGSVPFVYSTTPYLLQNKWGDITVNGTPPSHIVELRTPTLSAPLSFAYDNVVGPVHVLNWGGVFRAPIATNMPGLVSYDDPVGLFSRMDAEAPNRFTVADPVSAVDMALASVTAGATGLSVIRVGVPDVYGGADAAQFTAAAGATGLVSIGATTGLPTVGRHYYLEFDARQGSLTPLPGLRIAIIDFTGAQFFDWSIVPTPSGRWLRHRFEFTWKGPAPGGGGWGVTFYVMNAETGIVQLGRVRLYEARDPQNIDGKVGAPGKMIHIVTGVPAAGYGANGDFAMRTDGLGGSKTTMYHKESGAWVAVA